MVRDRDQSLAGSLPGWAVPATKSSRHWRVRWSDPTPGLSIFDKLLLLRALPPGPERELFLCTDPGRRLPELLGDPSTMPDAPDAAARITRAIVNQERIWVFGDYDVDGVTATAIYVRGLRQLGARPRHYLPHRVDDGFGLNEAAVRQIALEGCDLLITADCGTTDHPEVALARSLGMDVLVSDHHTVGGSLPEGALVVNPRRPDGAYPFRQHTAAGVAYTLLRAVAYRSGRNGHIQAGQLVQLAALGTVGDVAPLVGENRLIVRAGLMAMNQRPLAGIRALVGSSGLGRARVTATDLSYKLVPRLNAAGRMAHADLALELLLQDDPFHADRLAVRLEQLNTQRRAATDGMMLTASDLVASGQAHVDNVLTVYSEDWSPALLGIVAAQLVKAHNRPVIAASSSGGKVRASVRSLPGMNVMQALDQCDDLLMEHGGHSQAAGFTTTAPNLPAIHRRLCSHFAEAPREAVLEVDLELTPDDLTDELGRDLGRLAPFGAGNPEPVFALSQVQPLDAQPLGRDRSHAVFYLTADRGRRVEVVAFRMGNQLSFLRSEANVDLVVTPLSQRDGSYCPLKLRVEHIAA